MPLKVAICRRDQSYLSYSGRSAGAAVEARKIRSTFSLFGSPMFRRNVPRKVATWRELAELGPPEYDAGGAILGFFHIDWPWGACADALSATTDVLKLDTANMWESFLQQGGIPTATKYAQPESMMPHYIGWATALILGAVLAAAGAQRLL